MNLEKQTQRTVHPFPQKLSDSFEENAETLEKKQGKSHKEAWENRFRHTFLFQGMQDGLSYHQLQKTLDKRLTMFADS